MWSIIVSVTSILCERKHTNPSACTNRCRGAYVYAPPASMWGAALPPAESTQGPLSTSRTKGCGVLPYRQEKYFALPRPQHNVARILFTGLGVGMGQSASTERTANHQSQTTPAAPRSRGRRCESFGWSCRRTPSRGAPAICRVESKFRHRSRKPSQGKREICVTSG